MFIAGLLTAIAALTMAAPVITMIVARSTIIPVEIAIAIRFTAMTIAVP